ncbi:MAG: ComEA family DNA-binding protein [Nitrospira sp.]|jgi:competence protein ComEA|nr:ComEA family DNA-binding protein [Nitrospira sp.]
MSLLRSILLKLGMFALTMGVVFWIGWQVPQTMQRPASPHPAPLAQAEGLDEPSPVGAAPNQDPVTAKSPQRISTDPRLVDLNRASVEEFEQLPGVGPVLARRVVAYRESRGRFHAVEELRGVKGIGQKKLERLRRLVTVASPAASDKGEKAPI